jgi:hypothetical protein
MVVLAGRGLLRCLGLAKGVVALGLAPSAGLAILCVASTWAGSLQAPPQLPGAVVLVFVLVGLGFCVHDREALFEAMGALLHDQRLAGATLVAALAVSCVAMGVAFAAVQAPLSPHDGAAHVETSDAFRRGAALANWYPPGLAALFGAVLQLLPSVDSAAGAEQLGLGLTLLAPIAVFGLGAALWRNLLAASAAAVLLTLTHLFPYYPQIWSGWPQLVGIVLVLGLWTLTTQYLEQPSWRWAALAGLLVGAIVVVHGTELYTSAIVLTVVAVASWRQLNWRQLAVHTAGTIVLALICAAPYVPVLLHWAGTGGAYQAGYEDGTALEKGAQTMSALELLGVFTADALGVDLPIRVVLVVLGAFWAFQQRLGRAVVAVTLVFFGLAIVASTLNGVQLVRQVYSATWPWSLPYRHMTFASITLALLAGGGAVLARGQVETSTCTCARCGGTSPT